MSGRLTNTTASMKLSRIVDTVTHSASPAWMNPPSIQISVCTVWVSILITSLLFFSRKSVIFSQVTGVGAIEGAVDGTKVGMVVGALVGSVVGTGVGVREG
jgi:hypothetical protein